MEDYKKKEGENKKVMEDWKKRRKRIKKKRTDGRLE